MAWRRLAVAVILAGGIVVLLGAVFATALLLCWRLWLWLDASAGENVRVRVGVGEGVGLLLCFSFCATASAAGAAFRPLSS